MEQMPLFEAMRQITEYFHPLEVVIQLASPITMDVELKDDVLGLSVMLAAIPCRPSISETGLRQLINLIEFKATARQPLLFKSHQRKRGPKR